MPVLFTKSIKINHNVWRRPFFTQNSRGMKLADTLRGDDILLIPKKQNAWFVSYEHAAKKMLRKLDSERTCRKMCHRILKYDLLKWCSVEAFPGLSTYPLKVFFCLLWNLRKQSYFFKRLLLAEEKERGFFSIKGYLKRSFY